MENGGSPAYTMNFRIPPSKFVVKLGVPYTQICCQRPCLQKCIRVPKPGPGLNCKSTIILYTEVNTLLNENILVVSLHLNMQIRLFQYVYIAPLIIIKCKDRIGLK